VHLQQDPQGPRIKHASRVARPRKPAVVCIADRAIVDRGRRNAYHRAGFVHDDPAAGDAGPDSGRGLAGEASSPSRWTDRGYDGNSHHISRKPVAEARKAGVDTRVANIEDYEDDPFDAVVFSVSSTTSSGWTGLWPYRSFAQPGGVAIADEFAWSERHRRRRRGSTTSVVLGKGWAHDCDDEAWTTRCAVVAVAPRRRSMSPGPKAMISEFGAPPGRTRSKARALSAPLSRRWANGARPPSFRDIAGHRAAPRRDGTLAEVASARRPSPRLKAQQSGIRRETP